MPNAPRRVTPEGSVPVYVGLVRPLSEPRRVNDRGEDEEVLEVREWA